MNTYFCETKIYQNTLSKLGVVQEITAEKDEHLHQVYEMRESLRWFDISMENVMFMNRVQCRKKRSKIMPHVCDQECTILYAKVGMREKGQDCDDLILMPESSD